MLGSKGEFNKNFFYPGEIVDSSCSVKFTEVFSHLTNKFKKYVMPTCGYGCNSNPNDVKVAIASSYLNGCKYKPGIFLNLKTENYNIKFGKIIKLFELQGFKFMIFKKYETLGFEEWVNATDYRKLLCKELILFKQSVNRMPLPSVFIQNNVYVTARHCVFQNSPY